MEEPNMFWKKPSAPPPSVAAQPAPPPMKLGTGMPGKFERAVNDLELALVACRERRNQIPQFLEILFNSSVFVLPRHDSFEGDGDAIRLKASPHLFSITYPEYVALAFYTSPERAKPTSDRFPDFRFAAQVHAGDFLSGLQGRVGLVINPYWDINLEWDAAQMDRIRQMMRR
jgi:hypothetical protein